MLLDIQKPGLSFAMTPRDWWARFKRKPSADARPLVILRNFGPVDFVYDVLDLEGELLPEAAYAFPTMGALPDGFLHNAKNTLKTKAVQLIQLDRGDYIAGNAMRVTSHGDNTKLECFEIRVNGNHSPPTQLVTLLHELAHVYLGHCGRDAKRGIKFYFPPHELREVEAETVAYLVARRSGVKPRSESYLNSYQGSFEKLDLHRILTSANRIERLLGLPLEQQ